LKASSTAIRTALAFVIMLSTVILTSGSAQAQFIVLHTFLGLPDGAEPMAGLTPDSKGNLYGTTYFGGASSCNFEGCGVVYKVTKSGMGTVLYRFAGGTDGVLPTAPVAVDTQGNVYGTTPYGGGSGCSGNGCGIVFKISPQGKETVLYRFTGGTDGGNPFTTVLLDQAGTLYGATALGGDATCQAGYGCGVIYKLTQAGIETVLHTFTGGADGADPQVERSAMDAEGNIYGTTYDGGDPICNCGVAFKVNQGGELTVLHTFTGGADGSFPYHGLTLGAKGVLYGTASLGGAVSGVLFRISSTGLNVLYNFSSYPFAIGSISSVSVCSDGNVYGTTQGGGTEGWGTLWRVDRTGKETIVHTFGYTPDGATPDGAVQWMMKDGGGALFYGTTTQGGKGSFGQGTVYAVALDSETQTCLP